MKTLKPLRRSVSPFGHAAPKGDLFADMAAQIKSKFKKLKPTNPRQLENLSDLPNLPSILREAYYAPANDGPELMKLIQYGVKMKTDLVESGLFDLILDGYQSVFEQKTELFLIDHHDKEQCEALKFEGDYRDVVLFGPERDSLVGGFFEPISKDQPGIFSKFISSWVQTKSCDRILHFLDFAKGSKNPTFEHMLVFSHPALSRIMTDKNFLRSLMKKAEPLLNKLSSPTWESDVRKSLEL